MVKIIIAFILITSLLKAEEIGMNSSLGFSSLAIKSFLFKKPSDLEPKLCLIAGAVYQYGDEEIDVKKDISKAKRYYLSASDRGVIMADLILGNIGLEQGDLQEFVYRMKKVLAVRDEDLSIPAGYQLSTVYMNLNKKNEAIEVLLYLADNYNEAKAQFLVGWAIRHDGYTSDTLSYKDGDFYLYRACNNQTLDDKMSQQCNRLNLTRK